MEQGFQLHNLATTLEIPLQYPASFVSLFLSIFIAGREMEQGNFAVQSSNQPLNSILGPPKAFLSLFLSIFTAGPEMEQGFLLSNLATNLEIPLF